MLAWGLALPASAHEVEPPAEPSPLDVVGNSGNGFYYLMNELQHGHLDEPLLGLEPAVTEPIPYVGGHVAPVTIETIERIGGISQTDSHEHDETPEEPHDH